MIYRVSCFCECLLTRVCLLSDSDVLCFSWCQRCHVDRQQRPLITTMLPATAPACVLIAHIVLTPMYVSFTDQHHQPPLLSILTAYNDNYLQQ